MDPIYEAYSQETKIDEAQRPTATIKVNDEVVVTTYSSSESVEITAGKMNIVIHKTEVDDLIAALKKAQKTIK